MYRPIHIAAIALLSFTVGCVVAASILLVGGLPFQAGGSWAASRHDSDSDRLESSLESNAASGPAHSYADAVSRAAPAVVNIYGSHQAPKFPPKLPTKFHSGLSPRFPPGAARAFSQPAMAPSPDAHRSGQTSLGSGVLVSDDGLILTNRHIVDGADTIAAELPDGRLLKVTLLGIDKETDLAVLRATDADLPVIEIGDPNALRVGDLVLAIGNPFGIGQTVSMGIVSATGRDQLGLTSIEHFIQTDAAINPGNSGGPLIDTAGRLVGINTAILSETGLSEGIGFAIPADIAMGVVTEIAAVGSVERGWLGIAGRGLTPGLAERFGLRAPHGVLITSVLEDSPAADAGLRSGDVVTRAAGEPLHSAHGLLQTVTNAGPVAQISIEIWRGSEQREVLMTTAKRPSGGMFGRVGD